MNHSISKDTFNTNIAIISLYLTFVILFLFFKTTDFTINDYSKLYISEATLENVNISARIFFFIKSILAGGVLITICYFAFKKIQNYYFLKQEELKTLSIVSFIGIFLIILDTIGLTSRSGIKFIGFYFTYSILIIFFKKMLSKKKTNTKQLLFFHPLTNLTSVLIISAILLFLNSKTSFSEIGIIGFFIVHFCLTLFLWQIQQKTKLHYRHIFFFLIPLCLIPLFLLISIESVFFFKINHGYFISFKWLFSVLITSFTLLFVLINFRKKTKKTTYKMLAFYFVPATLLTIFIFIYYQPFLEQSTGKFEFANIANAQMKLFQFNQVPFIDYMSSHMFSEQFYSIIHGVFFGCNNTLDFLTYQFFYTILFIFIVYYFLLKIFKNPFLIFLFIIFFPFLEILINPHLSFGLLLFFSIKKLIRHQTFFNYFKLFVLAVFLLFWRLDTGVASCITLVLFLPAIFFTTRIKVHVRPLIKASLLFVIIGGIFTGIAFALRSPEYILTNLEIAFHYISANQAHGYSKIALSFPQQFYLFHLFFPIISVLTILYSVYVLRTKSYPVSRLSTNSLQASLFLNIIYLANFQRGIVRHGFMEHNDTTITSTFYIALVLFILSFLQHITITKKIASFYCISFAMILSLPYFPINEGVTTIDRMVMESKIKNIDSYFQPENFKGKIISNADFEKENYSGIRSFMNSNFGTDQTFMDFSNSPMLYFYCKRRVPSYFSQNLQNTIDDYLQLKQIKDIPIQKVPVVIYSNYPIIWFDRTDNVPNTMRCYLVAEHIYKNYHPYGVINKHSIWISNKQSMTSTTLEQDTLVQKPQVHDYKKGASIIYKHFHGPNKKALQLVQQTTISDHQKSDTLWIDLNKDVKKMSGLFMTVHLDKIINDQALQIEIISNNQVIGTSTFLVFNNDKSYTIRLSNHYLWHTHSSKKIRIIHSSGNHINTIDFHKDIRNER